MSILETIYHGHLQRLLGPNATITDVVYYEGSIEFKLPIDKPQDFIAPAELHVAGIYDGNLECSIAESSLENQLHFLDVLQRFVETYPLAINPPNENDSLT